MEPRQHKELKKSDGFPFAKTHVPKGAMSLPTLPMWSALPPAHADKKPPDDR